MRESQNLQKYELCRVGKVLVEKESPSGALASLLVDESSLRSAPGNLFGKHSFESDLSFAGEEASEFGVKGLSVPHHSLLCSPWVLLYFYEEREKILSDGCCLFW